MSSDATFLTGVAYGRALPSGRHTVPRGLVAANQRERLFIATASAIAERGYASLTVGYVTGGAGVSRRTFYQQFRDKHDCLIAAQRWSFQRLRRAIVEAAEPLLADEDDWTGAVAAGVGAGLEFAAEFPEQARLVLASTLSPIEPALARHGLALHRELVGLLHRGSRRFPAGRATVSLPAEAAVGAALSIVGARFVADEADSLPGLKTDLVQILLMPYRSEATRIAEPAA